MEEPTFTDYVALIFTLFDRFVQANPTWDSQRFTYRQREMMVFFMLMQQRFQGAATMADDPSE